MKYTELLEKISKFGHGVFVIPMIEDKKKRPALEKWIYKHQQGDEPLVRTFIGGNPLTGEKGHGDLKICSLTPKGMKTFGGTDTPTKAQSVYALVDMALINSYMAEKDEWANYAYKPKFNVEIAGKQIGIFSNSWYCSEPLFDVDLFLTTKWTRTHFLENESMIKELCRVHKKQKEEVLKRIRHTYTPRAFQRARGYL